MTDGANQGLFVIVAVVIFGIFIAISYLIFRDTLNPSLSGIFSDGLTQASNSLGVDNSQEVTDSKYFETMSYNGENYITKYKGDAKNVVIPKEIDGEQIHYIEISAFANTNVESLSFQNGFDGSKIFKGNFLVDSKIKELHLPDGATELNNYFGYNYPNLEKLTLPNTLKKISAHVFTNTKISDIVIPEGVTELGYDAFENRELKQTIHLPSSLVRFDASDSNFNKGTTFIVPNSIELSMIYGSGVYIYPYNNHFEILRK